MEKRIENMLWFPPYTALSPYTNHPPPVYRLRTIFFYRQTDEHRRLGAMRE